MIRTVAHALLLVAVATIGLIPPAAAQTAAPPRPADAGAAPDKAPNLAAPIEYVNPHVKEKDKAPKPTRRGGSGDAVTTQAEPNCAPVVAAYIRHLGRDYWEYFITSPTRTWECGLGRLEVVGLLNFTEIRVNWHNDYDVTIQYRDAGQIPHGHYGYIVQNARFRTSNQVRTIGIGSEHEQCKLMGWTWFQPISGYEANGAPKANCQNVRP